MAASSGLGDFPITSQLVTREALTQQTPDKAGSDTMRDWFFGDSGMPWLLDIMVVRPQWHPAFMQ